MKRVFLDADALPNVLPSRVRRATRRVAKAPLPTAKRLKAKPAPPAVKIDASACADAVERTIAHRDAAEQRKEVERVGVMKRSYERRMGRAFKGGSQK